MQAELSFLRPQVEAYENQQRLLSLEHHQLRLEIAVREKERILQEGDITHLSLYLAFIIVSLPFVSHEYVYFQLRLRIRELR
jgi:hypothetical protein